MLKMSVEVHGAGAEPTTAVKEAKCAPLAIQRAEDLSEVFKRQLELALQERDQLWRRHEKEQVAFIQQQHAEMFARLHAEIERMTHRNRELERRLYVECEPARDDDQTAQQNRTLKKELQAADQRAQKLAHTLEDSATMLRDQENRIRQLSQELDRKTLTVTQLSTQIRNYKLREAMGQAAQQRRRASLMAEAAPARPAAFRLFAPRPPEPAQPSAARALPFIHGGEAEAGNGIEKRPPAAMVRSLSAGIPPTKPHLLHALRHAQRMSGSASFDASR